MNKDNSKDVTPTARRTIGYIARHLTDKYSIWQGVIDAAAEKDVNVIAFFPHDLDTTHGFDAQANVLYDLINTGMLDGLVIWASTLMNYAGAQGAKRIFERYRSIPIVSLERCGQEDVPFLEVDSYQSMRAAVTHLIKGHGHRRVAFVRGPDTTHAAARQRYQGYLDALSEYNIPFDPDLVSPPTDGSWAQEVGEEAVALFSDQRRANIDALVGVCDNVAIGAMRGLEARGVHIPDQVAVVGFDDDIGSKTVIPPLTTVSLQGYEQGRQAVHALLTLLDGDDIPVWVKMPPRLIIRQSCGCIDPSVAQAAGPVSVPSKPFDAFASDGREKALSEMRQAAGMAMEGLNPDWAGQLLEAFFSDLKTDRPGKFLSALDGVLRQVIAGEGRVEAWANVLSALRRCALPYLRNSQAAWRAEDLWLQGQVMVGETAQQAQRHRAAHLEKQTQILNEIRAALITTFDMRALMDTLAQDLPRLGIPSCYLSLYENPQQPAGQSRLALAYDIRRGRLDDLETGKQVFPSPSLVPDGMLPQERRYSLVTEALYFRDEHLGFVLFEAGPREGPIYVMLAEEISSALQGAQLVQRVQERSAELTQQKYILDTFMDNIPDHIYFKDTQSRLIRGNRAYAQKMGAQDSSELIGKNDFDFFSSSQAETRYQQEQEIIRTGQPILGLEEPVGADHWALTTKLPLRDETGAIIGTFGISSDITELVKAKQAVEIHAHKLEQAYETLQKQQQILLTTEKMASLGRLTAGIAHEMNTPLAAVRAALVNIEKLIKEYEVSIGDESVTNEDHHEIVREFRTAVRLADKAAEVAAGFVRGIKSQTRGLTTQEQREINAVVAVEDALLLLNYALIQGKCQLDFKKSHNEIKIVSVVGRLEQIVTNLVTNAIDASQPQGGLIMVSLNKHLNFVELHVSDHGNGILPENLSKIFDPMFSTKPFGSGTGLGLTIVHDIVVGEFNGSIDVTSEPGQGATFTIRLPL